MTFEEAWHELMAPAERAMGAKEREALKILACAFYKAGEIQGVQNAQAVVNAAIGAGAPATRQ